MKKINLLLLTAIASLFITSCSTYKHSYRLSSVPQSQIGVTPTIVDVVADFDRQVTGKSDKKTNSVQDAKDNAYYNAIVNNKIDILVDPIYRIQVKKGFFKVTAKADVTGFAGSFANARTLIQNQENEYNIKLEALNKLVAIKEIQNEERNSMVISTGKHGNTTTTVNEAPAYLQQFNSLFNNTVLVSQNGQSQNASTEPSKKKSKGLLSGIFSK